MPGTTSGAFLAERLGHADALTDAEARYEAGGIDNHEVCRIDARGGRGSEPRTIDTWLEDLPLVAGIAETVAWCRERDVLPILASLAWSPVGAHLARHFGFGDWCGPDLGIVDGRYTGRVARSFDEDDKRAFVLTTAARAGLPAERCASVGDSRSDLPLFAAVGLRIAFNGAPAARAASDHAVDGAELTRVRGPIATWLEA